MNHKYKPYYYFSATYNNKRELIEIKKPALKILALLRRIMTC
jgi:hypothetical protein